MIEQWKSIKGYEGCYEVSNLGRVKSIKRYVRKHNGIRTVKERVLKQCYDEDGYKRVSLSSGNHRTTKLVHRLVAEAFIENPFNYPQINHKDENKENNCISNLEYCTAKYNTHYHNGIEKRAAKRKKPVCRMIGNSVIDTWESATDASKNLGICRTCIIECILGNQKTAGGYKWKFIGGE